VTALPKGLKFNASPLIYRDALGLN
jgi:hypothetical protein